MSDTIAAIAPATSCPLIIPRLSGDGTPAVIDRACRPANAAPHPRRRTASLSMARSQTPTARRSTSVHASVSRGPHNTGEDTAELQCHATAARCGGCRRLPAAGARQVPGRGVYRRRPSSARAHGSHTQAEAVIDLIHAETTRDAKNAAGQLGARCRGAHKASTHALQDIASHYHAVSTTLMRR